MRLILKIIGILVLIVLLIPCTIALWIYFSPFGIPDAKTLRVFAPADRTQATIQDCAAGGTTTAIPGIQMGRFRDALIAAEGDPQDESTFRDTARTFVIKEFPRRKALYSAQLARRLNCPGAKSLEHTVKSIRTAIQIERRFTSDEILTIYANSAYFGNDTYGIENASQTYFKKMAMQLSVSEAATLAGLIRRPDYLLKHPDRAVERRNEVLDAMLQKQLVSIKEAEEARSEPLNLGPKK